MMGRAKEREDESSEEEEGVTVSAKEMAER